MTVRLFPAAQLPPPDDRPLWRLLKGERCAQAVLRVLDGIGLELRVSVDGELRWSRLYRAAGVEKSALELRLAFEQKGWSAAAGE